MPLKATPTTATTLGLIGDINIANTDLQVLDTSLYNTITTTVIIEMETLSQDTTEGDTYNGNRLRINK